MPAYGSLATLGVAELMQIAALFRKMGSVRLVLAGGRTITIFFQDGKLSGLNDSGRVWQLGDLLTSMGRLSEFDKQRLLSDCKLHGKRLGQVLMDEGYVSREEMEDLLRRLIMQSLLFAVEHERSGEFELNLGAVSETSVQFPMADFLIEIMSAIDGYRRLREILGPGDGALGLDARQDLTETFHAFTYRQVQVLAHIDGEKTPMDVAATSPLSPTEALHILGHLAEAGVVRWQEPGAERPLAPVVPLLRTRPPAEVKSPVTAPRDVISERLTPGAVW